MLPTAPTPPKRDLSDVTVLLHGKPKLGKTSMCAKADGALFLATEPGLNALEVFQVSISSWEELLAACNEIAKGKHSFKTIVLDTIDNAQKLCVDYICRKHKIDHPTDLSYGKGHALVNSEFQRVLNRLAFLPYGLFLISHSQERTIETRTGNYTRVVPSLPDKARKIVTGLVDIILYCDLEVSSDSDGKPVYRRVLRSKPSPTFEAGDRFGVLPETMPLDYEAFRQAFQGMTKKGA